MSSHSEGDTAAGRAPDAHYGLGRHLGWTTSTPRWLQVVGVLGVIVLVKLLVIGGGLVLVHELDMHLGIAVAVVLLHLAALTVVVRVLGGGMRRMRRKQHQHRP